MKKNKDFFIEQLIRRSRGGTETLVKVALVLAGIIILAVLYRFFYASIWPFFLAVVCVLEFFAFNYTVKEFEYSFINGDVSVDKISGKRRRKTVLSLSTKEITHMAPCAAPPTARGDNVTFMDYSINRRSPGLWYFTATREDGTELLVLFNPNERLREAFKSYLGNKMDYELPVQNDDTSDDRS
ncbi:MAG: hypothetical protein GXY20_11660 [Clostridiales bacterium]|nr:hypothetical protein [Clostridiales bacterium]